MRNRDTGKVVTFVSFLFLILITIIKVIKYLPYKTECFPDSFLTKLILTYKSSEQTLWLSIFCLGLICFRILFGLIFIYSDDSFNKNEELSDIRVKKELSMEFFFTFLLNIFAIVLINVLWTFSYKTVMCTLYIIILLIILYDIAFWNKLFKRDKEHKANYFIGLGDIFSVILVFSLANSDYYNSFWFYFISGGFASVFLGEFVSQYWLSLKKNSITFYKILSKHFLFLFSSE